MSDAFPAVPASLLAARPKGPKCLGHRPTACQRRTGRRRAAVGRLRQCLRGNDFASQGRLVLRRPVPRPSSAGSALGRDARHFHIILRLRSQKSADFGPRAGSRRFSSAEAETRGGGGKVTEDTTQGQVRRIRRIRRFILDLVSKMKLTYKSTEGNRTGTLTVLSGFLGRILSEVRQRSSSHSLHGRAVRFRVAAQADGADVRVTPPAVSGNLWGTEGGAMAATPGTGIRPVPERAGGPGLRFACTRR